MQPQKWAWLTRILDPRNLFPRKFVRGRSAKILFLKNLTLYGISALIALPIISKTKHSWEIFLCKCPHSTACVFMAVVRTLSFSHSNSDFVQLRVPGYISIHSTLECNFPLEEMDCEMPLAPLSLALVITAHCECNLLYLPVDNLR